MKLELENDETASDTPQDAVPESVNDYDPEFPGSTPEAPYGFKADGTPYKRRPNSGTKLGKPASAKTGASAANAAALLRSINSMVALSLLAFGMPLTGTTIEQAGNQFESMARDALESDPALAKRILSMGANTGKAQLAMAYITLGVAVTPVALAELREKRKESNE